MLLPLLKKIPYPFLAIQLCLYAVAVIVFLAQGFPDLPKEGFNPFNTKSNWEAQKAPFEVPMEALPEAGWKKTSTLRFPHSSRWNDVLWLRFTPPAGEVPDPALTIPNSLEMFECFDANGRKIYQDRIEDHFTKGDDVLLLWSTFQLPKEALNSKIYFRVRSSYNRIGLETDIYYGSFSLIQRKVWQQDFFKLLATMSTFWLGVMMLSVWAFKAHLPNDFRVMLFRMGIFSLSLTGYAYSRTKYIYLSIPEFEAWRTLEMVSLYLSPFFGSIAFRSILDNKTHFLFEVGEWIFLGFGFFVFSDHILTGTPLKSWLTECQILLLFELISFGFVSAWQARSGSMDAKLLTVGICSFIVVSLIELLRVMSWIPLGTTVSHWASLLLVSSLLSITIVKAITISRELARMRAEEQRNRVLHEQGRLAALAQMSLYLGDRLNNPLAIILLETEDLNDAAHDFGEEEWKEEAQRMTRAIVSITSELQKLNRYKKHAMSSLVNSDLPLSVPEKLE